VGGTLPSPPVIATCASIIRTGTEDKEKIRIVEEGEK
jgi:hypothetical protein